MPRQTTRFALVIVCLTVIAVSLPVTTARAYLTGPVWPNSWKTNYSIDPNLDNLLGVTGVAAALRAADTTWDDATIFSFNELLWTGSGNIISAADFRTPSLACPADDTRHIAITCQHANPTTVTKMETFFNISGRRIFNMNNINSSPNYDIQSVMTHELGHWFALDHSTTTNSVMGEFTVKRTLGEDDKQGVTQLYGVYTGFDYGRATGINSLYTYYANVDGYLGIGTPMLGVVANGDNNYNVNASYGTHMLRMAGRSTATTARVYFKLFSQDKNQNANGLGFTIPSGARLQWCQYNYQQSTMSIDMGFSDGTSLRDSVVTDQYGIRLHPKDRSNYGTGIWRCFNADLSPVVGKQVRHFYVAYDNGGNSVVGDFRSYFDSVKILWPGGKP